MPDHLAAAARARSNESLDAVRVAVRRLSAQNKPISVSSVAADAGVSRNFIYTTPEAREVVLAARAKAADQPARRLPAAQRGPIASDASLRTRLAAALQQVESLTAELVSEREKNAALIAEVMALQNPVLPPNVRPIRQRRF